jgi:transposase
LIFFWWTSPALGRVVLCPGEIRNWLLNDREDPLSETRKYRKFTAQQKTEIVLASLRGPKSVAELCREHEISDSLLRKWRDQFLAAGAERLQGKSERTEVDELRGQVAKLERALGRETMEVEIAGELLRGWE